MRTTPVETMTAAAVALLLAYSVAASAQEIRIAGVTRPSRDATLAAAEAGRIEAIEFEEGETVAAGDTVILLDHALQKLEVERRRLIEKGTAQLEAGRARVEMLKEVVASTRQLYEKTKSVSREELKAKELELRLAKAEVTRLELQEKRETVEREMAEQQLWRRRIVAPIDGIVVKVHKEVGEACSPNDPLMRIANVAKAHFDAYTEPRTASKLAVGMAVQLVFGPDATAKLEGTVTFVSPVVDPASGLQRITAAFTNTDRIVRPGQQGTLIVDVEE